MDTPHNNSVGAHNLPREIRCPLNLPVSKEPALNRLTPVRVPALRCRVNDGRLDGTNVEGAIRSIQVLVIWQGSGNTRHLFGDCYS